MKKKDISEQGKIVKFYLQFISWFRLAGFVFIGIVGVIISKKNFYFSGLSKSLPFFPEWLIHTYYITMFIIYVLIIVGFWKKHIAGLYASMIFLFSDVAIMIARQFFSLSLSGVIWAVLWTAFHSWIAYSLYESKHLFFDIK